MSSTDVNARDSHEPDDRQLLREYASSGSAHAFASLVERHLALVYAAAMRQCRNDPHHAQDVTQVVFMALAQKARSLGPDVLLSGWLVRATHFAARSLRRAETRRKRREAKAAAAREREAQMKARDEAGSPVLVAGEPAALWERIAPFLDEALARLPAAARDVLVLRFLEGKSFDEVGKRLGTSEEAARKRANRALSSLRAAFGRRGIRTMDDALAAALPAAAAGPVPAEVARAIVTGAGAAHHHAAMLKGALKLMAWTKAKTTAVAVAAALLIGGGGAVVVHRVMKTRSGPQVVALEGGPRPGASAIQQVPAAYSPIARGVVRDPAGRPVAGARVMIAFEKAQYMKLTPDPRTGPPTAPQTITASDGSFSVAVPKPPLGAVIVAPDGVTEASSADLSAGTVLTVRPYARIEGTIRFDHDPSPREKQVAISTGGLSFSGHLAPFELWATTDAAGHFVIERVPPGQYGMYMLGLNLMGQIRFDPGTDARVEIDLTTRRPVAGRIEGIKPQAHLALSFISIPIHNIASEPAGVFTLGHQQSDAVAGADGSFTSGPVLPGTYRLTIGAEGGGHVQRNLQIPPRPPGSGDAPIDLGTLVLKHQGS